MRTVIVVGAGASQECGLPIGSRLTQDIGGLLNFSYDGWRRQSGDELIALAINKKTNSVPEYYQAAMDMSKAMPLAMSIDNYLDAHAGNVQIETCGKFAIVRAILQAESASKLFMGDGREMDFFQLKDTWYVAFWRLLAQNKRIDDLAVCLDNITFVIFNYDRCVEHFLFNSIQTYYRVSREKAAEILQHLKVFHPYGSVGALPWSDRSGIAYGATPSPDQLIALAERIKTFTEGTDPDSSEIGEIRAQFSDATTVLFLGFHYHPQNLELLQPPDTAAHHGLDVHYYGTGYGLSDADRDSVVDDLAKLTGIEPEAVHIAKLKCAQVFQEFSRTLLI
ncbi:hypothetical protein ACFPN2_00840 [Steroidobacter flavus]|uniref:SIR2-like domain-containing protein n=1 Tax=Steroidobacter flavus TaxID=1842136 RepID=A0ABV8SJW6_9GAMM